VVQCRRAVQASEAGFVSTPTGLCDPCYGRLKLLQPRERVPGTPTSPITLNPLPSQQLGCEDQPAVPVLPLPAVLLGTPVQHAPVTGTDICDQAASAPLLSSGVGSDNERMVNRVFGGGCSTCLPSAPPARIACASGAAYSCLYCKGTLSYLPPYRCCKPHSSRVELIRTDRCSWPRGLGQIRPRQRCRTDRRKSLTASNSSRPS